MPETTNRPDTGQLALELPSALPNLALEPEWKAQARLWGHSLHPMCSYLASFPAALAHAFIARYSRPGDVVLDPFSGRGTAPVQAAAEGRIGVGNDLNPLAHVLTSAKLEPGDVRRGADPARGPAARVGRRGRALAGPRRPRRRAARPPVGVRAGRRQRRRAGRAHRARPRRGQHRVPPADAGAAPARPLPPPPRRPDRPVPRRRARGHPPRQDAAYLSTVMPNTFSMAPRYVRDFVARTGYEPPERDVFDLLAAKLDRLYRQPLPTTDGDQPAGRRADGRAPVASGAARPRPAGPGPARDHLAALPARAQVRLLQLAPDVAARVRRAGDRRRPRRRPPARALPRVHARRPRRPPARAHRRRDRGHRHRRRRERPRQALDRRASGSRRPSGSRPRTRRATGSPASCATRSPPTAR